MVATPLAGHDAHGGEGLEALLAEARRDSVEFPVALANHGPMALTVLHRLGASDARLQGYFADYRRANGLIPPPPPAAPVERATWADHLGDRSREADYRAFFTREVTTLGIRDAVGRYLPALAPGVAGSALHPLMRLAYGVSRNDPSEVGTALGYWAACFLPLPVATGASPETDDPDEVLARVAAIPGLRKLPVFDHLWYGIRAAAAEPDFAPAVDWLRIGPGTLARVAATSLALFAGTMDFAALHALTGTHWVRMVATVCPDPLLLRHFWQTVAALVPAIGFPQLPDSGTLDAWRNLPCPDWNVITEKAVTSADEHDISLVYSASEEQRVYGDRLYQVVAARRMGLIA
ncbi:questin oxidase family protein [Lichenifustis flavocetrariae]|uniref:Questin oxidase family protein n=1 Tax=Lichenifustis flavocetrariae TaxID=2949735 RepID=A0AA41YX43_9HYPH|nr:questin oxidase family protein [Lichenifustis flavocetrariae]MCW6506445.1 questin oxidase family protein [Lichenifustis flavocetrariae]